MAEALRISEDFFLILELVAEKLNEPETGEKGLVSVNIFLSLIDSTLVGARAVAARALVQQFAGIIQDVGQGEQFLGYGKFGRNFYTADLKSVIDYWIRVTAVGGCFTPQTLWSDLVAALTAQQLLVVLRPMESRSPEQTNIPRCHSVESKKRRSEHQEAQDNAQQHAGPLDLARGGVAVPDQEPQQDPVGLQIQPMVPGLNLQYLDPEIQDLEIQDNHQDHHEVLSLAPQSSSPAAQHHDAETGSPGSGDVPPLTTVPGYNTGASTSSGVPSSGEKVRHIIPAPVQQHSSVPVQATLAATKSQTAGVIITVPADIASTSASVGCPSSVKKPRGPRPDLKAIGQSYRSKMSEELQRMLNVQRLRRESLVADRSDLNDYLQDYQQRIAEEALLRSLIPASTSDVDPELVNADEYIKEQQEALAAEESEIERLEAGEKGNIKGLREYLDKLHS